MLLSAHTRRAWLLAGMLFVNAAHAESAIVEYSSSLTLSSIAEHVYQQLPGKQSEASYLQQQQAYQTLGDATFAQPAVANMHLFHDKIGSDDGMQEWEGSVDLPLWLSGQKDSHYKVAEQIAAQLPAYQQQLKLQASGEIRNLVWQIQLAESALKQSTSAWQTAQKLEQDVKARVEAGDLAATERLLAQTNTLELHVAMAAAESMLQQALKTYTLLTGETVIPEQLTESQSDAQEIDERHPLIQVQDQYIQRLRAEMGLAKYAGTVNPNLSVGIRHDRGSSAESFNNSLGVGVSIPLNNDSYNQTAIAEASARLAEAEVTRQTMVRTLKRQLLEAQQQLFSKQQQLSLASEQDSTSQQYYQLQKRAFELGEINLTELLRSQVKAHDIRSRKQRLQIEIQQQTANINQILGLVL